MSVRAIHPPRLVPGLIFGPGPAGLDRVAFRLAYLVCALTLAAGLSAAGGWHDPEVRLAAWLAAAVAVPIGGVAWTEVSGGAARRAASGLSVVLAAFLLPGAVAGAIGRFGGGALVLLVALLACAWPAMPRRSEVSAQ